MTHPNDKQNQIRELRRELRRARNYQPNPAMSDAVLRAALVAAREEIDRLERELAYALRDAEGTNALQIYR